MPRARGFWKWPRGAWSPKSPLPPTAASAARPNGHQRCETPLHSRRPPDRQVPSSPLQDRWPPSSQLATSASPPGSGERPRFFTGAALKKECNVFCPIMAAERARGSGEGRQRYPRELVGRWAGGTGVWRQERARARGGARGRGKGGPQPSLAHARPPRPPPSLRGRWGTRGLAPSPRSLREGGSRYRPVSLPGGGARVETGIPHSSPPLSVPPSGGRWTNTWLNGLPGRRGAAAAAGRGRGRRSPPQGSPPGRRSARRA